MPTEERNEPHKKSEPGQEREHKEPERIERSGETNVQKPQGDQNQGGLQQGDKQQGDPQQRREQQGEGERKHHPERQPRND